MSLPPCVLRARLVCATMSAGFQMLQTSASTDLVRPDERQSFWTESICRSFANVETCPLGPASVRGHFEFIDDGNTQLLCLDSSQPCSIRISHLVSGAGSDDFM